MGGRGSSSSRGAPVPYTGQAHPSVRAAYNAAMGGGTAPIPNVPNIQNQAPDAQNTAVTPNGVAALAAMSDDQLAALVRASRNVDMPNHLKDVDDKTQKFVYAAGLNAKPTVLDDADFDQYLIDHNIPRSQIMSRTVGSADASYTVNGTTYQVSPDQIADMVKYSALTYVGGKRGGMLHGAGTYFDQNGGRSTAYGNGRKSTTMLGVLSPNARTVDDNNLRYNLAPAFARSHPKFAREVGSVRNDTLSIYALAMGYNAIKFGSYVNSIDRQELVMRRSNV